MIKRFERLFIFIALVMWLLIMMPYLLVQHSWGAKWLSRLISHYSHYQITIGQVKHSLLDPYHLELKQVLITDKNWQKPLLDAPKITITLLPQWPFSLTHVQQITFHQATLLPASQQLFNHSPISANSVQFLASKLLWQSAQHQILAENIDGGFTPLSKTVTPDTIRRFKFTAGKVSVDQFIFNAFYLQG